MGHLDIPQNAKLKDLSIGIIIFKFGRAIQKLWSKILII